MKAAIRNQTYKSVATYIFSNFFSKGISLLLIFVFTNPKYLTPADNGILSLFSSNLMLLSPFVSLGMIQSAGADFFKKSSAAFKTTFATNFVLSFLLAFCSFLLLLIFRNELQAKFEMPSSFIYIIPFLAFLVFCSEQLLILVRNRSEVRRFAVLSVIKAIVEYGVSVLLVVYFFKGWQGRILGIAVSLMVINLLGVFYYIKNDYLSCKISKQHILGEIKFGIPFIVFQLCVFLLGSTNKLFLALFDVDKSQLGIYAIACVFGTLVGSLGQSIFLYVQPKLYKSISSGEATYQSLQKAFFDYFKMLLAVSIPCMVVVVIIYQFLLNKIYLPGLHLFFIVSISTFLWQLNFFLFSFLLYYKAKRKILLIAIISIIISIVVNTLMVKYFMIEGDALASLINTCIFSFLVYIPVRKLLNEKLENNASIINEDVAVTQIVSPNDSTIPMPAFNTTFAPIAYFAFNRPEHTRLTLEALKKNQLADQSILYIFIDGPAANASEDTKNKIEAVKKIAYEQQWCGAVSIHCCSSNKGLFKSIVDGIDMIVSRHGKLIVVEDDVLVSPGFLSYMNNALDFYEHTPQVMHISGFSKAAFNSANIKTSTYFFYHSTCWGWATWKRAWDKFSPNAVATKKAISKKGNISRLNMDNSFEIFWGLQAIADGKFQSWNTLWHAAIFLNDGLCLHPAQSLASNIGHDGSGTNCTVSESYGRHNKLAEAVTIDAIPLQNNEIVRKLHLSERTLFSRCMFIVKHYLRYISYGSSDILQRVSQKVFAGKQSKDCITKAMPV